MFQSKQFLRVYTSYAINMSTQRPWYFSASRQGKKRIEIYSQGKADTQYVEETNMKRIGYYSQGKSNRGKANTVEERLTDENTVNMWRKLIWKEKELDNTV